MKKKKIIVGNWKMYVESEKDARTLLSYIKKHVGRIVSSELIFCPPFPFLSLGKTFITKKIKLGTQNISTYVTGAHTGEVGVQHILPFKVSHVIVGHSERRKEGETSEHIRSKIEHLVSRGITPIVCVGEDVRTNSGEYLFTIEKQLKEAFKGISPKDIASCIIAYEPVWAIGAKEAMDPHQVHEMVLYIKKVLKSLCGDSSALVPILYGGSVNDVNAHSIFTLGMVDGLLIGRDSVDSKKIVSIIKTIDSL